MDDLDAWAADHDIELSPSYADLLAELRDYDKQLAAQRARIKKLIAAVRVATAEPQPDDYRSLISVRTREALARLRAAGRRTNNEIPVGYRLEDGTLREDPDQQDALAVVCRMRARGQSWRAIANHLNRNHPRDAGVWHARTLNRWYLRRQEAA